MILPHSILIVLFGIMILFLYIAFAFFRGSAWKAFLDLIEIVAVVVSYLLSFFASVVRIFGKLFPFTSSYEWLFNKYPGSNFAEERREEFIQRGIAHIEREEYEIEQSPHELVQEIQSSSKTASRQLSDGEALFGFALAAVGYFSIGPKVLATFLSFGLALAVAARLTALNTVLFKNPDLNESPKRLLVMDAWNRAMSNGVKILSALTMFRFIRRLDERFYELYLDRILDRSFKDDIGKLEAGQSIYRPFLAVVVAKNKGLSPSEASQELFSENVFDTTVEEKGSDEKK